ncbi:MAG: hypothetical protein IKA11_00095, partial [Clostridia bacterium]|nr:hypothetical protein [Clostridia bacterium]
MKSLRITHKLTLIVLSVLFALTFSLGIAFMVNPTVKAAGGTATTYDYPVPSWNNATYQGAKVVLVRPKADANTPLTFDTTTAISDETQWAAFAEQLTLEQYGVGEITATADLINLDKSKAGGFNTTSSTPYMVFGYSSTASWINATSANYVTLTIPQNATLYGVTFANALELYFYDGLWSTAKPKIAETTGVTMNLVGAYNFNNKDIATTYKTVLITLNGLSTVDTSVNVGYINDFNSQLTATWGQTDVSSKIQSVAAHYPMLSNLGFSLSYLKTEDFVTGATYENPVIVNIPKEVGIYNFHFTEDYKLYFYDGVWSLTEPKVAETTGVTINTVGAHGWNNRFLTNTDYNTVLITLTGLSTVNTTVNTHYLKTFNQSITATWENTDITSKIQTYFEHYAKLSNLGFILSYLTTEEFISEASYENPVTVTIPKEVGLYNFHFTEDYTLYFYEGIWSLTLPKTEGRVNVPKVRIGGGVNDNNAPRTGSTTENQLILYAYDESNNYVSNSTDYVKGDLNEKITLTYGGNTYVGADSGIYFYKQANDIALNLAYPNDAAFLTHTADIPYLTIPANTIQYKWIFTNEVKLWFVNGAWTLTEPVIETPVDVTSYKIERSFNNYAFNADKNILLVYPYTSTNQRVQLSTNVNPQTYTTFIEALTLEYNGVTKTGAETGISLEISLLASYERGILLSYSNAAEFLDATAKNYATLTVAKGTGLFNTKLTEDLKIYYADGEWTMEEPFVFDYDLSSLDKLTIGELVENSFAKKPTFKLGEPDLQEEIYQGVINSTKFLSSTNYILNFKFKVNADRYSIKFVLNSNVGAVEAGITIRFFNQSA